MRAQPAPNKRGSVLVSASAGLLACCQCPPPSHEDISPPWKVTVHLSSSSGMTNQPWAEWWIFTESSHSCTAPQFILLLSVFHPANTRVQIMYSLISPALTWRNTTERVFALYVVKHLPKHAQTRDANSSGVKRWKSCRYLKIYPEDWCEIFIQRICSQVQTITTENKQRHHMVSTSLYYSPL